MSAISAGALEVVVFELVAILVKLHSERRVAENPLLLSVKLKTQ
jgi:hypothetical protein